MDHILSDLSTMTRPSWVAPRAWLSFIELEKAMVLVWLDWLVFCGYGFSVSALWCSLATPTIFIGFLLPWTWGISSRMLQQSAAAASYFGWGVSPHHRPSWPWTWSSSSRPSYAHAATSAWVWGCSSRSLPLTSDVGWLLLHCHSLAVLATAPDLVCGVAPLGCACVPLQPPALLVFSIQY